MNIIIQKFGGSSLASGEIRSKAIDRIGSGIDKDFRPVVVVSAIGREESPYSTDRILSLVDGGETSSREKDLLLSCGEVISAVVLHSELGKRGYKSRVLTGYQAGIKTNSNYGDAEITFIDPKEILSSLSQGEIPIVTGFQGFSQEGYVTTLGRGGSDITAAALGKVLKAQAVEIYTDVDGVMTADPRIVKDACVINTMPYSEVFQMAEYGSKVIHPRAVEIAMSTNIPLIIKNTKHEGQGTLITSDYKITRDNKFVDNSLVNSVAHIDNMLGVEIKTKTGSLNSGKLLEEIAGQDISIDMINIYPDRLNFIIKEEDKNKLVGVLDSKSYDYSLREDQSKVTIIGSKIRGIPGVMAKLVAGLNKVGVEILQSSDSHTTISCLIASKDKDKALNALHKEFELGR